jgi:hypothetical protein
LPAPGEQEAPDVGTDPFADAGPGEVDSGGDEGVADAAPSPEEVVPDDPVADGADSEDTSATVGAEPLPPDADREAAQPIEPPTP